MERTNNWSRRIQYGVGSVGFGIFGVLNVAPNAIANPNNSRTSLECFGSHIDSQEFVQKDQGFQDSVRFLRSAGLYIDGDYGNTCERQLLVEYADRVKKNWSGCQNLISSIQPDLKKYELAETRLGKLRFNIDGEVSQTCQQATVINSGYTLDRASVSCGNITLPTQDKPIVIERYDFSTEPIENGRSNEMFDKRMNELNLACSMFPGLELDGINISSRIKVENLKDANGNAIDAQGLFSSLTNRIELLINDNYIFGTYFHELTHYIDSKYNISDWKAIRYVLGGTIFNEWQKSGYLDNNNTVPGEKTPPNILTMLKKIGLKDYSLYMGANYDTMIKVNKIIKELSALESAIEKHKYGEFFNKKNKLLTELKNLEDDLIAPREVLSTAMETILELDDTEFNSPEVQGMLERYFDVMYSKSKLQIFSPLLRKDWIKLVRLVNSSLKKNDHSTANTLIQNFYRQNGFKFRLPDRQLR
jgi:hypothetical protein